MWGTEGKDQAAADQFFEALDPEPASPSLPAAPTGQAGGARRQFPAIMVPFSPCPTVLARCGICPAAWLPNSSEHHPQLVARASREADRGLDGHDQAATQPRCSQHAPQAEIVIDNYHVTALATKALDKVRTAHCGTSYAPASAPATPPRRPRTPGSSLLKNPYHLTDRQAATLAALHTAAKRVPSAWAHEDTDPWRSSSPA